MKPAVPVMKTPEHETMRRQARGDRREMAGIGHVVELVAGLADQDGAGAVADQKIVRIEAGAERIAQGSGEIDQPGAIGLDQHPLQMLDQTGVAAGVSAACTLGRPSAAGRALT